MDYQTAVKEIKLGNPRAIYLLYGTESFLIEEFIQFAKNELLEDAFLDFNFHYFDLNETPIARVIEEAETLPFMGERRMVVADNALFFTGASAKASQGIEHRLDRLQDLIENPSETCILLLLVPAEKLDERKKIVKMLKEKNAVIPFMPLKETELQSWIKRRTQKLGVMIDESAVRLLQHFIGNDLRRLKQELDKLSAYAGRNGVITEEAVHTLTSRTMDQDIFQLIGKVSHMQIGEALRLYYDLLKSREEPLRNREEQRGKDPLMILNLLARQFRLILQVKVLAGKGYTGQQMASMLGVHPYPVKLAMEQSHRFSEKALKRILSYLAEEDYRIKSGKIDKVMSVEMFIVRVKDMIQANS